MENVIIKLVVRKPNIVLNIKTSEPHVIINVKARRPNIKVEQALANLIRGKRGEQGVPGEKGVGIVSIAKTSSVGLVDTYTILLSNGQTETFTVTNGKDGEGGSSVPENAITTDDLIKTFDIEEQYNDRQIYNANAIHELMAIFGEEITMRDEIVEGKAEKDASNLDATNVTQWQTKLNVATQKDIQDATNLAGNYIDAEIKKIDEKKPDSRDVERVLGELHVIYMEGINGNTDRITTLESNSATKTEVQNAVNNAGNYIDGQIATVNQKILKLDNEKADKEGVLVELDKKLDKTTKYGSSLSLTIDNSTYVVTAQLKDQDGNNLGTAQTIDLPLESVVVSGSYDATTKQVILTLKDGSTVKFSVADLVSGLASQSSLNETNSNVRSLTTWVTSIDAKNTEQDASITNLTNNKVDKITGRGLSEANYTIDEKTKLAGIEEQAQKNVTPDWSADITSDAYIRNKPVNLSQFNNDKKFITNSDVDTKLTGYVTRNIEINGKALTGDVTLTAEDVGALPDTFKFVKKASISAIDDSLNFYDQNNQEIGTSIASASSTLGGIMSKTDKAKLDTIEANAQPNVQTDWNETDPNSMAYLKNKPDIPKGSVLYTDIGYNEDGSISQKRITELIQNKLLGVAQSTQNNAVNVKLDNFVLTDNAEIYVQFPDGLNFANVRYLNVNSTGNKEINIVSKGTTTRNPYSNEDNISQGGLARFVYNSNNNIWILRENIKDGMSYTTANAVKGKLYYSTNNGQGSYDGTSDIELSDYYVDNSTNQTIAGVKNFTSTPTINGVNIAKTSQIPTTTSQLTNNSGFLTSEADPTVPSHVKNITTTDISNWNNKLSSVPSTYKTKTENDALYQAKGNYLTSVPSEYVTETELTNKGYATNSKLSEYLPLSGGTLTGGVVLSGGSGATGAGNIQLSADGSIADVSGGTLFGRSNSGKDLKIGSSTYNMLLRGKQTRPTYNGNDLALFSDVSNGSKLVADYTLSSASSSINLTGLDLINDGGVYDVIVHYKTNAGCDANVRVNNISSGVYRTIQLQGYTGGGISFGGGKNSTNFPAGSVFANDSILDFTLSQTSTSSAQYTFTTVSNDGNTVYYRTGGGMVTLSSSITSITLNTGSPIQAGARIRIYARAK